MINKIKYLLAISLLFGVWACKSKKNTQQTPTSVVTPTDTLQGKCRLDFKNGKALSKYVKENEFTYKWVFAKANVESNIDNEENSFDVKVRARYDSAIFITIEKLSIDVAKILITKDSVKVRIDVKKQYFKGDFKFLNEVLNTDIDFEVLQAVMFGNSAEFLDDETSLKGVTNRTDCVYMLSTERKRRLRRIQAGDNPIKKELQTLTLNPENFKILKNEFIDPITNRIFLANYSNFTQKDSVYAPYHVNIDILAEKKAKVKIEYVRIEKNVPQKIQLNIPKSYDAIEIKKK